MDLMSMNSNSVNTINGPATSPKTVQLFGNMLQQQTSLSPLWFTGLIIKGILFWREKSEGIWSCIHWLAYAAVMILFQPFLVMRQLLKEREQRYGHCRSTTLFVSEQWLQYLFSSAKPSRLTRAFSSSRPRVHKHNLLSHILQPATQVIQRQMLHGKQTTQSAFPSRNIPSSLHWEEVSCSEIQKEQSYGLMLIFPSKYQPRGQN